MFAKIQSLCQDGHVNSFSLEFDLKDKSGSFHVFGWDKGCIYRHVLAAGSAVLVNAWRSGRVSHPRLWCLWVESDVRDGEEVVPWVVADGKASILARHILLSVPLKDCHRR